MRVVALLSALLVPVLTIGMVSLVRGNRRRGAIARAPAAAMVESTDSINTVKAKQRAYARHLTAMRLLGEVRNQDETLHLLSSELRKEIDEFLDTFYGAGW